MAELETVVQMLGENKTFASFLELAKKLLIDWVIPPKKLLHTLHNISKENFWGLVIGTHEIKEINGFQKITLDFKICIDRSKLPIYPDWVDKVIHPDLEVTGPYVYNLLRLGTWSYNQSIETCGHVYNYLLQNQDSLSKCLGLADLHAIQTKGTIVFLKRFGDKPVFGWKSVVQSDNGFLKVPYLTEHEGNVILLWIWLDDYHNNIRTIFHFNF